MSNDVLTVVFASSGFDRAAQGVVGAGRALASQLDGSLRAVIIGRPEEAMAPAVAAVVDELTLLDQPELSEYQPELCLAALQQVCSRLGPAAVLLGNDTASLELTPRLAHRVGGSSMADCTEVTVADGFVRVRRIAYGGRAVAVFELKRSPAVIGLRARGFDPAPPAGSPATIERVTVELPDETATRITERLVETQEGIPLDEALVVVGGGRGLGGPESFDDLKKLADVMTAGMGASRAACDEGWVPPSLQIGQTGKKIAPELYLAIAISGAAQHMLGVSDAKVICAINTDPDASIFHHCTFGMVEDYRKVVPRLLERLGELKQ